MDFFIDTADIQEIKTALEWGLVDGVTTNPSLIAKTGRTLKEVVDDIVQVVNGPISVEVTAMDAEGMIAEGRELAKIHENIVVKVPMTLEGLKACRTLAEEEIGVNMTLIFSPMQALLAAKAGALFVSPFVGRLDDVSESGMELVHDIVQIFDNYGFDTEVLVASVRSPMHVYEAAMGGADVCTIPFNVIGQLVKHPLTDVGIAKFMKDWEKVPK